MTPPPWTHHPITLSDSPACRACLLELRELVYLERRRVSACKKGESALGLELGLGMDGERALRGAGGRAGSGGKLGVRYPPLPKWMEKLPGNRRRSGGKGRKGKVGEVS